METAGMDGLIVDDSLAERFEPLRDRGTRVALVSEIRSDSAYRDSQAAPGDGAMVLFTSGSTGKSKGVLLTQGALSCNARGVLEHTRTEPSDRVLHIMPLYHTNGINNQLIVPFLAGATVLLVDRFRAEEAVEHLRTARPTYMTGVPTIYSRMIPFVRPGERFESLRFLRCGSAPITETHHRHIEDAFGTELLVSYGLSEATCTSTMNPPGGRRIGTVGTVLAEQTVRLFKPETDTEVAQSAEGEIRIAGPTLMTGYLGEGVEQLILDGWLRTGDLGRFDEDGYLSITGRIKDVIIRGGENISPTLIERTLTEHPSVSECCVVGMPHEDLGEVLVAFVTLTEGASGDADGMKDFVRARLSRIYVPEEIRFVASLPTNRIGKVDRKALRRMLDEARP
jgi:acyl-CoA synthetase (AMP-forming)/AMP-acid ligase II